MSVYEYGFFVQSNISMHHYAVCIEDPDGPKEPPFRYSQVLPAKY